MTEPSSARAQASASAWRIADRRSDRLIRQGFRLGPWRVEPRQRRLISQAAERRLDPRSTALLVAFASRPGDLLSRDHLLDAVWHDAFVSENTLTQAISRLRRLLDDDRQAPRYIETVSKSGYRLVASVGELDSEAADQAPMSQVPSARTGRTVSRRAGRFWLLPLAALVGLAAWQRRAIDSPAAPVVTVRPALTHVGKQFDPALSPDGQLVAFAWQGPDQSGYGDPADFDIWVQSLDTGEPTRLTDHPDQERFPVWSPDGSSLVFARASMTDRRCGLYRALVSGGTARRLLDCPPGIQSLAASPDATTLVVSASDEPGKPPSLALLSLEDGQLRPLTRTPEGALGDHRPAVSPDGQWIAFERRENAYRHRLMVVGIDGDDERPLTADAWGQMRGVVWSADSRSVLFSSNRTGRFLLWRAALAGGAPTRMPINDDWVTQPGLSRHGHRLIYRTFRDVVGLHALSLSSPGVAAGEPLPVVPSTRSERDPVWSPDGVRLAFLSDRSGTVELWSGRPDGLGLIRHTDFAGPPPESPAWSPDGRFLVFDAAHDGHADLWRVEADGRRPERLTDHPANERNPSFTRDGRAIYFASDRTGSWQIFRMPAAGGAPRQMTQDGGFFAVEAPDGGYLLSVRLDRPGIWRQPLTGGAAEPVVEHLDLSDWGSWTAGAKGLYYIRRKPTAILYQPYGGGQPQVVYQPAKQLPYLARDLSLSRDGKLLLFAMIDRSDDEVMLADL